jgi:predicted secreted hydrolase
MRLLSPFFAMQAACAEEPLPKHAAPGYRFSFPGDHGSHPDYETEWWYVTGQLVSGSHELFEDTADYGVQLTFFRRRLADGEWGQAYLAHGALTDVRNNRFYHATRYARSGLGVAGSTIGRLFVWNHSWSLDSFGAEWVLQWDLPEGREIRLIADGASLRSIWLQGQEGFSRKASCEGCGSLYYSIPQIQAHGELRQGNVVVPVRGMLWMDHEVMTNALQPDQVGWDWASLTTAKGESVMLFRIRGKTEGARVSTGAVFKAGRSQPLLINDNTIQVVSEWQSPATGARYPAGWRITIPEVGIATTVRPLVADQELKNLPGAVSSYWEGAVASEENKVIGYVELTGYGESVGGAL